MIYKIFISFDSLEIIVDCINIKNVGIYDDEDYTVARFAIYTDSVDPINDGFHRWLEYVTRDADGLSVMYLRDQIWMSSSRMDQTRETKDVR